MRETFHIRWVGSQQGKFWTGRYRVFKGPSPERKELPKTLIQQRESITYFSEKRAKEVADSYNLQFMQAIALMEETMRIP